MPLTIDPRDIEFSAVRAQGPGGQNVHKVSSAVHLRFDIRRSSLPDAVKERLLQRQDQRITKDGVIVIKAQSSRSQDQNKAEAVRRLEEIVAAAATVRRTRRATAPTFGSRQRRLDSKALRSSTKSGRSKVSL
ncbi:alternative ribosome rescue aminoacyl-tRNA hydrolase ArfB [uncultured Pseudacidovorax sp.]|uniref:alternative ribosome rescue aminoacyl-tRNA hydrolase ArfB n=1 Tax=uncultured Pseudacidovorax sp. TaxID=679313 RepID=UPI0025CE8BF1|nr:alternative ribosome rescue aminoacyl-tRNA hydrolase ArfB [uncultured Pseudacidovorax sp.]